MCVYIYIYTHTKKKTWCLTFANETYVKIQKHLQNTNDKNSSEVVLVFSLLTLNIFHTFF